MDFFLKHCDYFINNIYFAFIVSDIEQHKPFFGKEMVVADVAAEICVSPLRNGVFYQ